MEGALWPSSPVKERIRLGDGTVLDAKTLEKVDPGFPEGWGWPRVREVDSTKKYYFVKENNWYLWDTESNTITKSFTRKMPDTKGSRYVTELSSGKFVGIRLPDWVLIDPQKETVERYPIHPDAAGPDLLEKFTLDNKNRLWVTGGAGNFFGCLDFNQKKMFNFGPIRNTSVETYGLTFYKDKLWFAVYSTAELIVYDPKKPYNEWGNINPKVLGNVKPFCRPVGKSVVGPDGAIWTGFSDAYGKVGHCLARLDPETLKIERFENMVPQQSMSYGSLSADDKYIYYSTDHRGDGGARSPRGYYHSLVIWDPFARKTVYVESYENSVDMGLTQSCDDILYYRKHDVLVGFSLKKMKAIFETRPPNLRPGRSCTDLLIGKDGGLYMFWVSSDDRYKSDLYSFDPATHTYELIAKELKKFRETQSSLMDPEGHIYFMDGSRLMRLTVKK